MSSGMLRRDISCRFIIIIIIIITQQKFYMFAKRQLVVDKNT